ncbi:sensor histidine kinase [Sediminibacterium sp. TEGAF015]|uniref:sensor histidine kinase n=1 Tax=Sediminibacterium sp. TEGAF015 TaxID=575378 RepID=UPI002206516C|nr:7TM diverse intracellular signaling domain-containing protein [Sediminibacterium sp. TEGAF015]BDQ12829.1 hypothetical protein TEGAF0_20460 [Sediminibacterium sp. TEGAF015]
MFTINNKPVVIFISVLLFAGFIFSLYTITQSGKRFEQVSMKVMEDKNNLLPSKAVVQLKRNYKTISSGFFNPGFSANKWWILAETPAAPGYFLQIANPHINEIRIYTLKNNQPLLAYESGDYFPFKKRFLDDPDFWFPIPFNTEGVLIEVDKRGESLEVPVRIITQKEMIHYLSDQKMVYGIFLGWMIFLGLLNIFLWASLKDNIHVFYILFIGSSALWVIANWGLGFQYIWPNTPEWASKARPVFSTTSFLLILELASRYFTPDERKPVYIGFTRLLQSLLLILLGVFVFGNIIIANQLIRLLTLSFANILWFLSMLTVLFFIAKSYQKMKAIALFFLFAFLSQSVFGILIIFSQFNVEADWVFFINRYGSAIGILANSTILSFGLSQRYNYYKQEREQAQQELVNERNQQADRMIQAQEEERSRLARELHDGLGGLLGSIRIGAFNKLKQDNVNQEWLDAQLSEAIEDLRNIAHDLMPVSLPEKGLVYILEKTVARWNAANQFKTHLDCSISKRYPLPVEAGLYRIVSELIYNVKKHARASEVYVSIWEEKNNDTLTLLVEDNGIGFSTDVATGIGLKNIRYRVDYLGGKVSIDSNSNGTSIVIEISGLKKPIHAQ